MTILELKEELNRFVNQSLEVRFAFIDSENSDSEMMTYSIDNIEGIPKAISSNRNSFCLITTNEKCIEDV